MFSMSLLACAYGVIISFREIVLEMLLKCILGVSQKTSEMDDEYWKAS